MAKNTEYEFEETMVTLTDEDGIDKDFYVDEIYEVDGRLYAALIPGFVENITEYYVFRIKDLGNDDFELEEFTKNEGCNLFSLFLYYPYSDIIGLKGINING